MSYYHAQASDIIPAPPDQVYAIISDYHEELQQLATVAQSKSQVILV